MTTRRGFLLAAGALAARGAGPMRAVGTKGGKISVFCGERPLFEYRYDRSRPKPYVHPLYLPNGEAVTLDGPEDHVHHRGLMLAWSALDGIDFWGETNPARHGRIEQAGDAELNARPGLVEITATNNWIAEGRLHLVERRTLRAAPPSSAGIWLDWTSELTAPEAAALATGGHVYNGLGIRFAHSLDGGRVLNERGTTAIEKANGESARWCAYYGPPGGVALFDHPSNPRHPTPFFVMNKEFGYMTAAPTFRSDFAMAKGDKLTFRWGVLSFLGSPEPEALNGIFRKWSAGR